MTSATTRTRHKSSSGVFGPGRLLSEIETDLANTLHAHEECTERDKLALDTGIARKAGHTPPLSSVTGAVE